MWVYTTTGQLVNINRAKGLFVYSKMVEGRERWITAARFGPTDVEWLSECDTQGQAQEKMSILMEALVCNSQPVIPLDSDLSEDQNINGALALSSMVMLLRLKALYDLKDSFVEEGGPEGLFGPRPGKDSPSDSANTDNIDLRDIINQIGLHSHSSDGKETLN